MKLPAAKIMHFLALKRDPIEEQHFKENCISKQPKFPLKIQLIRNVIACHKVFQPRLVLKAGFLKKNVELHIKSSNAVLKN